MATSIRLSRGGSKKRPYYRIVVADSRAPRDGKFIERIGSYNPVLPKGDEKRVVQVLYNLLANAVGFSPQDSTVGISARRTERSVVFTVTDSGPGIPADMKDKVFNWFESRSQGSRHRGAGLGLSLVRSFVELHGGKVRVDSIVGRGTVVICDFPTDQAAHRDAAE